jgi:hypothetical protein
MSRLSDADLLVYLDGSASPELTFLVEGSPENMRRAGELTQLQRGLHRHLFRVDCPSPLRIGEFHLNLLPPGQAAEVRRHLARCPHCQAELNTLQDFLAPRPGMLERARILAARLVSGPGFAQRAPAPGLRGSDEPWVYAAGALQVVLNIQADSRRPERKTLAGLVLGQTGGDWQVTLLRGDEISAQAGVDELGNFLLADLPAGSYELRITSADEVVLISPLVLD